MFLMASAAMGQSVDWLTQIKSKPFLDVRQYDFQAQTPVSPSSLTGGSPSTITIKPVIGLNGSDVQHRIYISGGTGTAEAVLITGGTCSPTSTGTCTLTFTPTYSHSNSGGNFWKVGSATAGAQEASQVGGANAAIYFPAGTYTLRAPITAAYSGQMFFADSPTASVLTIANSAEMHAYSNVYAFAVIGSKSDVTFSNMGLDGNFANQTFPDANQINAIDGADSIRTTVEGCQFHAFGTLVGTQAPYANIVSLYRSHGAVVRNNLFLSNYANEINLLGASGWRVESNQFGLSDYYKSNVNWWDTGSGGFGTLMDAISDGVFKNNKMYGASRDALTTGACSGVPCAQGHLIFGVSDQHSNDKITIDDNEFHGLGNGQGTVSVTQGSGAIVGTNTNFDSGLDGKRFVMVEGDSAIYQITTATDQTHLTLSPVMAHATASGLRYKYINSGDAIGCTGCNGGSVSNNVISHSGDIGIHLIGGDAITPPYLGAPVANLSVIGNKITASQTTGIAMGGALFGIKVSGNYFLNNAARCNPGVSPCSAIYLTPSAFGAVPPQNMAKMSFGSNHADDGQPVSTQQYLIGSDEYLISGSAPPITVSSLANDNYWFTGDHQGDLLDKTLSDWTFIVFGRAGMGSGARTYTGKLTLVAGTITYMFPVPYTNSGSFFCVANPNTVTQASPSTSDSFVKFNGPGTTTFSFQCDGK